MTGNPGVAKLVIFHHHCFMAGALFGHNSVKNEAIEKELV
jgi:hypothetical protein